MSDTTTQFDQTEERPLRATPMSALEIVGAVSAKVLHDLANLVSGIIGNAEFAEKMTSDAAALQKALQAVSTAANAAGKVLGGCLPLQLSIAGSLVPYDVGEMAANIAESSGLVPGWRASIAPALTGHIKVQPRWLVVAVWQIAQETDVPRGEVEFATGPAVFPIVWHGSHSHPENGRALQLFHILLRYRSEELLAEKVSAVSSDRPGLLAACELIRRFKGEIHFQSKPPGRQEISVLIPLL
jgi:hypothetical protein